MIGRTLTTGAFVIGWVVLVAGCSDDDGGGNDNQNANGNVNADCVPSAEIPDNGVDENCDGWLGTSRGFSIRAAHPRVLVDPDTLAVAIARMTGPEASEPYASWFALVRDSEDSGEEVDLANLALIYLGQWTLSIEASQPALLDHFLNVISLRDPGVAPPDTQLVQGTGVAGAVVDDRFALFATEPTPLDDVVVDIPHTTTLEGLVLDLLPDTGYYVASSGDTLELSTTDNGGTLQTSSPMGVLVVTLP